ncbi:hypothetical protein BRD00_00635 [Halobacteriales archaeon QS_8_69_26]|nr:MAG: hypothetical protein BRD00_00635 [Halobacteriales archaeon QS_8_69_26]
MDTSQTVSITRRSLDYRAIAAGAIAETAVILFPVVFDLWFHIGLLGPFVGGAVAGWTSRSFEHEANDGGVAAFAGTLFSLVGFALLVWFGNPGTSVDARLDIIMFMMIGGVFLVLAFGLAFGFVGAVVAHVVATARRRSPYVPSRT